MTVDTPSTLKCPACGSELSRDRSSEGLCPACLIELALESPSLLAELEGPDEDETLVYAREAYSPGQVLGKRYRIRSLLGRGGMGEVWRASDLKLRVDVALKALRRQLLEDTRALETLHQEVRVAREVVSPNVCRVFDLVELDGQELVSMEYIDGITLLDILKMRAPLDLSEAREIASQFLAGLEAIHHAGLVHRDVKPENLMMTRSGRVVLMDFGIAKGLAEGITGTVSGTPAYMAPEQSRGEALDARADVFSAGVVLTEMIAPGGLKSFEARQQIWQGIHHEPPEVPDSPWTSVLAKAVAAHKEQRQPSAAALARALEEVTLRVAGAEDIKPYPGLASFTEADAEYFFGRELEIEAMWKKLQRPHLLGLIAPSGAGKSSFLKAGLLPVIPTGWRAIAMAPGSQPFSALARSLVPELAGDTEALQMLTSPDDSDALLGAVARWRQQNDEALIVVDQFEELFTQNPPEVQHRFADLLARLALESDAHVLLSMRDDFLAYCSHQESLSPIFSELTPLKPLAGGAVRRALVQPALKCGYRFKDDALVDEMVAEVRDERGALPLLAFAASRLWDHRDREQGLLTREAYEHIGGVGGALAQHAEQTLERIGQDRVPIVRELFRNLVTAQGTRASRNREELLSVFDDGEPAEEVLNTLIDARLLTSYEVPAADDGEPPHHRIEIIHESLLSNWPRLVRWQTQDADSAQLRDQIRQAAQMWEERGQPDDLLWTGTSFGEYQLWRDRYEGGLSTAEEDFGGAMVHKAERQKRRRRIAISSAFGILLVVLGVITFFGWQAEQERRRAEAESLRAEAGKLIALGEVEINSYPTATLAWATKSLELADTSEARLLALRAIQAAPPVRVTTPVQAYGQWWSLAFSPHGEWLANAGNGGAVGVRGPAGEEPQDLGQFKSEGLALKLAFRSDDELVVDQGGDFRWLSVPSGEELWRVERDRGRLAWPSGDGYFSFSETEGQGSIYWWPYDDKSRRLMGSMPDWKRSKTDAAQWELPEWSAAWSAIDIDTSGSWLVYSRKRTAYLRSLKDWNQPPGQLGVHQRNIVELAIDCDGTRVASRDESGEIRIWSVATDANGPFRTFRVEGSRQIGFDPTGRWLASHGMAGGSPTVHLWDLSAPQGAEPILLARTDGTFAVDLTFHPNKPWLVTANHDNAGFWPLADRYPWVLRGHGGRVDTLTFTPDGEWLISAAGDGVRGWPLRGQNRGATRILLDRRLVSFTDLALHPSGEQFAVGSRDGTVLVAPFDGGPVREMPGRWQAVGGGMNLDFSPDGRILAAIPIWGPEGDMIIRVWNLETGNVRILDPDMDSKRQTSSLYFDDDRRLRWVASIGTEFGDWVFDLEDGSVEKEVKIQSWEGLIPRALSNDGSFLLAASFEESTKGKLVQHNLETGENRDILSRGEPIGIAIDPFDQWFVTGGSEGWVEVGLMTGEEPHLLLGHEGNVFGLAVSPDGRWIASGGADGTVRLWPTPDLSKPPLHTLPHDELIAKLESLTNLRVVEDPDLPSGWKIDYAPFPGWREVPQW